MRQEKRAPIFDGNCRKPGDYTNDRIVGVKAIFRQQPL